MFKYIVTAAVALLATPAFGQQQDFCGEVGDIAEVTLSKRYDGVGLSRAISILNGVAEPGAIRDLIKLIIIDAYKQTLVAGRVRHVASFRNQWEVACYEAEGAMA